MRCTDLFIFIFMFKFREKLPIPLILGFPGFPLCSLPPERIVDGSVFQESGEHKHKAHDEVDVYCLDVGDTW